MRLAQSCRSLGVPATFRPVRSTRCPQGDRSSEEPPTTANKDPGSTNAVMTSIPTMDKDKDKDADTNRPPPKRCGILLLPAELKTIILLYAGNYSLKDLYSLSVTCRTFHALYTTLYSNRITLNYRFFVTTTSFQVRYLSCTPALTASPQAIVSKLNEWYLGIPRPGTSLSNLLSKSFLEHALKLQEAVSKLSETFEEIAFQHGDKVLRSMPLYYIDKRVYGYLCDTRLRRAELIVKKTARWDGRVEALCEARRREARHGASALEYLFNNKEFIEKPEGRERNEAFLRFLGPGCFDKLTEDEKTLLNDMMEEIIHMEMDKEVIKAPRKKKEKKKKALKKPVYPTEYDFYDSYNHINYAYSDDEYGLLPNH